MKRIIVLLAVIPALLLAYSYYLTDALTSINGSNWTQNGVLSATSGGLTSL